MILTRNLLETASQTGVKWVKQWSWPYFILISLPLVVLIGVAFRLKAASMPIKIGFIVLVLLYGGVYSRLVRRMR
ncbi:hypothetical protein CWI35_06560 [[Bacillus] caldolyticus]|jgi:FtsH-binding integral membrane protein|uniref:Uncharacterized protein n=2 Tax=Geobacillus TaxID=129337 RepID=A0A3L7CWL2_GEOSE|nr:hypothetical protein CWI35_06560 [[Bacillus] caldolyticus]EPR29071.1 hypothetical protein I656_01252 [Geobacillus sp. WSUCF1]OQP18137.1 hypothetical protein B1693_00360 [Geobacillus zalihae]RLP98775.1 hypothetical protein D9545_12370 [Geobacillus stearothermophilus]OQP24477.1 hypothetical protein B1694_04400 [Geobacillus zalihae]